MFKKVLFSMLAALVLVTGMALAGERFHRMKVTEGGDGPHIAFMHHGGHIAEELGLNAEQKESAKELHEELMAKAEPVMEQHHQQMKEIHELLDAGNTNAADIGQRMITAHATRKQLHALHEDGMERFKALLTEEQQAKLEKLEVERPMRRRIHMRH
ncbi:MAG TPA: Spy/CpxP family protein refolding chaperone [Thermoanaerobaculia bacterium]|nr:Spy/CpxP family protein refolding chaperone [Thermoanaerobaculia bacterium]